MSIIHRSISAPPAAGVPFDPEETSDEVLMLRVSEGDSEAYETLYNRYRNRILTFVYRYVGQRDTAEDITQDVFLKIYRNPRAFDPRSRFVTWLYTVARNLAIDSLRRKRPRVSLHGEDDQPVLEPSVSESHGPVASTLMSELEENVQRVLQGLSDKLREVFVLCAMQGLSYEEVARIVGCPVKTVSSRLSRAREHFHRGLKRYRDVGGGALR